MWRHPHAHRTRRPSAPEVAGARRVHAAEVLMRCLADGRSRAAGTLVETTGLDAEMLASALDELERWGLDVVRRDDTVRLRHPLDVIQTDALLAGLPARTAARIERLEHFGALDSTNRWLLENGTPSPGAAWIATAEYQHAGRGRRGRSWIVPPAAGLCLSASWRFSAPIEQMAALPLAAGAVLRRALREVCGVQIALKWPNDLVWDGRKLGGILVEQVACGDGDAKVVVGVGINVALPSGSAAALSDWPGGAVDLAAALGGVPPGRCAVAAAVISALVELLAEYASTGLVPYCEELAEADCLRGQRVVVIDGRRELIGTGAGIDAEGALLLENLDGGCTRVVSGDVSVRPAA